MKAKLNSKYKFEIYTSIFLLFLLFSVLFLYKNFGEYFTYVKYNDTVYVLCSVDTSSEIDPLLSPQKFSITSNCFFFETPKENLQSNRLKKGTEIYAIDDIGYIFVKHNNLYYKLDNTTTTDSWGNGMTVRLD